jgi:hypothetical protein
MACRSSPAKLQCGVLYMRWRCHFLGSGQLRAWLHWKILASADWVMSSWLYGCRYLLLCRWIPLSGNFLSSVPFKIFLLWLSFLNRVARDPPEGWQVGSLFHCQNHCNPTTLASQLSLGSFRQEALESDNSLHLSLPVFLPVHFRLFLLLNVLWFNLSVGKGESYLYCHYSQTSATAIGPYCRLGVLVRGPEARGSPGIPPYLGHDARQALLIRTLLAS